MTKALIIGIHGLANKPEKSELTAWWYESILEGLRKNQNNDNPDFDFELVYWADVNHSTHLHNDENNRDDFYNTEPYIVAEEGALNAHNDYFLKSFFAGLLELGAASINGIKSSFGGTVILDKILEFLAVDLDKYYTDDEIREEMRNRLVPILKQYEGRKIMVIAHSMGSIIAYDVLTIIGKLKPDFPINHLVTIGSPLGLEHVKEKIIDEFTHRGVPEKRLRTPTIVKNRWVNHADRRDPISVDSNLSNDFGPNRHNVVCEDNGVNNDYKIRSTGSKIANHNPHKSYGYLRTPEMSKLINYFI